MEIDANVVKALLEESYHSSDRAFFNEDDEEDPIRLGDTHVELFTFCYKIEENLTRLVNQDVIDEVLGNIENADEDHVDAQRHRIRHFLTPYDMWVVRVYADKAKTTYTPAFEKAYEFYMVMKNGGCLDDDRLYLREYDEMFNAFKDEIRQADIQNMNKYPNENLSDLDACTEKIIEWMREQPKMFSSLENNRGTGAYPDLDELDEAFTELGYVLWDQTIGYHSVKTRYGHNSIEDLEMFNCGQHDDGEPPSYMDWLTREFTTDDLEEGQQLHDQKIQCNVCRKILNHGTFEWETPLLDPRQMELPI